jgi:methyl-accepting chemotaxis protein
MAQREAIGDGSLDVSGRELLAEIGIDEEELAWRKEFLGFDDEDAERLASLEPVVDENLDDLVEAFNDSLYGYDRTREVIGRSDVAEVDDREYLDRVVAGYYRSFTGGEYDLGYYAARTRIGRLHDKVDMPLHFFGGMFANAAGIVFEALNETATAEATEGLDPEAAAQVDAAFDEAFANAMAVIRGLNLDMQVINDTYIHSYSESMRAEIEESRRMRRNVEEAADQLEAESGETAAKIGEIEDLAADQASNTEEVATEVSQLSATVQEVAATADQVATGAEDAREQAADGREFADEAIDAMEELSETRDGVTDRFDALVETIDEIDEIVEVINSIAEQTNLLALNASIEAARAGEAGSGFAVVADEVKALANESKEQAERVEAMINDLTDQIERTAADLEDADEYIDTGVDRVEEVTERLDEITESVTEATSGIEEVARATEEQAEMSSEIARYVDTAAEQAEEVSDRLDEVTDSVAAQAERAAEMDAAVSQLRTEATADTVATRGAATDGGPTPRSDGGTGTPTPRSGDAQPRSGSGDAQPRSGSGDARPRSGSGDATAPSRSGDRTAPTADADPGESGATDGRDGGGAAYDTPDGLPPGIPDFVKETLDEETKDRIRRGELDRPDWTT